MSRQIPQEIIRITSTIDEYRRLQDATNRRLFLYGEIAPLDEDCSDFISASMVGQLVESIMQYNREDKDTPVEWRSPIRLYINSPGGDLDEGFSLVDAIEISKTPIYTINIGQWSSMSFLIGIAGHKRFSFPSATFLLHDGSSGAYGSANKVQDRVKFEERYEHEVVKTHVLKHGNMSSDEYDALARVEYYMLPNDALRRGFIDYIVESIDDIL